MKTGVIIILTGFLCASLFAEMRVWTDAKGEPVTGEFERELFDDILIRDAKKKTHLLPKETLSPQDVHYIHHQVHPEIEIDVVKKSRRRIEQEWVHPLDNTQLYTCTVRLKKKSRFTCKDTLTAELYIIADETDGDNYILIQRDTIRFVFPEHKKSDYEFTVRDIPVRNYFHGGTIQWTREAVYRGYIVAVFDSRGQFITYKTDLSEMDWLRGDIPSGIEKLQDLAVQGRGSVFSRHFDESLEKSAVPRMPWQIITIHDF